MDTMHTAMGYEATRDEDGTMTIHRVPIFCACERGDVQFDDAWITQAVKKAQRHEREGYMPPLHIRHHEPTATGNDPVKAAGYFRVLGTQPITFKGSRCTAVMADLVITCPTTQQEVMAKRLPYRSVEIFNVDKPAFDGLALLDHEAPFLELPMLMVANLKDQLSVTQDSNATGFSYQSPWQMDASENDTPVVACFRRGSRATMLFREEDHGGEFSAVMDRPTKAVNMGDEQTTENENRRHKEFELSYEEAERAYREQYDRLEDKIARGRGHTDYVWPVLSALVAKWAKYQDEYKKLKRTIDGGAPLPKVPVFSVFKDQADATKAVSMGMSLEQIQDEIADLHKKLETAESKVPWNEDSKDNEDVRAIRERISHLEYQVRSKWGPALKATNTNAVNMERPLDEIESEIQNLERQLAKALKMDSASVSARTRARETEIEVDHGKVAALTSAIRELEHQRVTAAEKLGAGHGALLKAKNTKAMNMAYEDWGGRDVASMNTPAGRQDVKLTKKWLKAGGAGAKAIIDQQPEHILYPYGKDRGLDLGRLAWELVAGGQGFQDGEWKGAHWQADPTKAVNMELQPGSPNGALQPGNDEPQTLKCPVCGDTWNPGHMNWEAFQCVKCKTMVDKEDWILMQADTTKAVNFEDVPSDAGTYAVIVVGARNSTMAMGDHTAGERGPPEKAVPKLRALAKKWGATEIEEINEDPDYLGLLKAARSNTQRGFAMNMKNAYDKEKGMNMEDEEGAEAVEDLDLEEGLEMAPPGLDVASVVSAIESGEISVADMDSILAAIQTANANRAEATTETVEEEEPMPAPAAVPGAEAMKRRPLGEQMAALQGENEAMRADIDTMKADALRKKEVFVAMRRLEGRPLGSDLKQRLVSFHKDHGAKAFDAYVDGLAKTTGVLPGDDGKGEAFQGQLGTVPEVAMKYQDKGTDAVDKAAVFARQWETLKEKGHSRVSLERYVEINMATPEARS